MTATYQLIELTSGNVAGDYTTKHEALARLRQAYETHGATAIADLSLLKIENGEQQLVAMQDDLVNLILIPSSADRDGTDQNAQIVAARRRR